MNHISLKKQKASLKKGAFRAFAFLLAGTWMVSGTVNAEDRADTRETEYRLTAYLQLEPLLFSLPAFRQEADINGKTFSSSVLFSYPFFDREMTFSARPKEGDAFMWQGKTLHWKTVDSNYTAQVGKVDSLRYAWTLSCFYLRASDYTKATLELTCSPAFKLYMDGVEVLSRATGQDTAHPAVSRAVLKIEPGYHVFMLQSLYTGQEKQMFFSAGFKTADVPLALGSDVDEFYGLAHYLNAPTVYAPQLSHSGEYIKLSFNHALPHLKKFASVHRIYRVSDLNGKTLPQPVLELEGVSGLAFAEAADMYAYMKRKGGQKQVYVGKLGEPARLVYETAEELSGFAWEPQGRYLILQTDTKADEPQNGLKKLENPMDQWPYYRNRTALSKLCLASGSRVPLTYGYHSASLFDISSDGRYLLFATEDAVDTMRQYMWQHLYRMDLETLSIEELFSTCFPGSACFSPDGKKLLVKGSEQMFKDPSIPGVSVPCQDCFIPNDYQTEAFIFDIESKKTEWITEKFGPSVQQAKWGPDGNYIYLYADEHDFVNLYAYKTATKTFTRIPAQTDVVNGFDVCSNALLYTGSSIDKPYRAYLIKGSAGKNEFAAKGKAALCVADPQGDELKAVRIGGHRDWFYLNTAGDTIEAVYYLPPDFDENKRYPCIVYYYSGTTPTPRALSMRYPKSVWASNGYVVLVVQPSGAIGYNRGFSAAHVNNWGITVAEEIIAGVRRFCSEHSFVDSTKLGCIGASYGGFMTQLLVTRTDLFAAAISHAGISSISSYWGEGYWGYLYGSSANAFSFPWNRRDIFVDQSPLFNADKVHTPLLLLHGTSDVNVPIGESYQMYKALRVLGRPVAMVTVAGEDHGIVDYAKRTDWEKTILAWFEKYLKNRPQWWESLYPDKKM